MVDGKGALGAKTIVCSQEFVIDHDRQILLIP